MNMTTTNNTNARTATDNLAAWVEARYAKYLAAGATDAEAIAGIKQDMLILAAGR